MIFPINECSILGERRITLRYFCMIFPHNFKEKTGFLNENFAGFPRQHFEDEQDNSGEYTVRKVIRISAK